MSTELERVVAILDRIERDLYSKEGLIVRVDRMERIFRVLGSGGLTGLALVVYFLWRIGALLAETGGS